MLCLTFLDQVGGCKKLNMLTTPKEKRKLFYIFLLSEVNIIRNLRASQVNRARD